VRELSVRRGLVEGESGFCVRNSIVKMEKRIRVLSPLRDPPLLITDD